MNAEQPAETSSHAKLIQRRAVYFVVLMGIVSLLGDMVYEGGRSISGPYLALLGAGGAVVGIAAGAGELIAYGLRSLFGYLSDRTRRYWAFTIAGYTLTALAVPALALAGNWQMAVALLILERMSKALRSPARDTLLSHATAQIGHGKGFGLHEALDQIGAVAAPLLLSAVIAWQGDYRPAFALLLIPGIAMVVTLLIAWRRYPHPEQWSAAQPPPPSDGLSGTFRLYLVAVGLLAAGYADFALIGYHLQQATVLAGAWIPALYAVAMAVDAVAAYLFGVLFDRFGLGVLGLAALLSAGFAPLAFSSNIALIVVGVVLWGIGMGAQESVVRAAVARLTPLARRGTAYGLLNSGYGICWFAGSALMGVLYDWSLPAVIAVSIFLQLGAVGLFIAVARRDGRRVEGL